MPMPTILTELDWKGIFESAKEYDAWLAEGEYEVNRQAIKVIYDEFNVEAPVRAYLAALERKVHVVALAEDWCPDVVRHVPVLQKMTEYSENLQVRYVDRQGYQEVLVRSLTVGGEAIPKFKFFNNDFVECGEWGPMPHACRELIARGRACGDLRKARESVSALYSSDPSCRIVVEELLHLIEIASCNVP